MLCRSCNTDKDESEFYTRRVRMSSGEITEWIVRPYTVVQSEVSPDAITVTAS